MYLPEQLGRNIRHFRKALGLTQAELAQRLFLTPQNVSKWENGTSAPDVTNLCLVAEALGVSVERLLGAHQGAHGRVMIGIDGGGTKTELCLFDESRCFGVVANMEFLLVCTYGEYGANPELLVYKKR